VFRRLGAIPYASRPAFSKPTKEHPKRISFSCYFFRRIDRDFALVLGF